MQGFSFIELLLTSFILSVGLLGYLQAELVAIHHTQFAYTQSLAVSQKTQS